MRYWQVSAGTGTRGYAKYFLKYGMAFVGGKDAIKSWARIGQGDRIVLKEGLSKIIAVGEVSLTHPGWKGIESDDHGSGYKWLLDVDGWELPAFVHVEWKVPNKPLNVSGFTRATLQQVHKLEIKSTVDKLLSELPSAPRAQPPPTMSRSVSEDEILEGLIEHGLRISGAEEVTHAFQQIRLLAKYYKANLEPVWIKEHETRTFLVVPLLLALGWSEQQMKIEYIIDGGGRVDIACFEQPFKGDDTDSCRIVIETKGFNEGLDTAPEQGRSYATKLPGSQILVVTNGYSYKVYKRRETGEFSDDAHAYLNVLNPRDKYPLDHSVEGCVEALKLMMP